jgi:hypothetical protein
VVPSTNGNGVSSTNINATNLGASNTNLNNFSNYGALAKGLGQQLYPERVENPKDKWLYALQFFTNMAAAASQPGATAIGAAGAAGSETVKTLLEERKQKRAEELAATQMGATLLGQFKPTTTNPSTLKMGPALDDDGKQKVNEKNQLLYTYQRWQGGKKIGDPFEMPLSSGTSVSVDATTTKYGEGKQDAIVYMTEERARAYLMGFGLDPENPNFESYVERLTPNDGDESSLIGKAIVENDRQLGISFIRKGDELTGLLFRPLEGAAIPREVEWAKGQIKKLNKNQNTIEAALNTVRRVDEGLDQLLDPQLKTGKWTELTLPMRQIIADAFNLHEEKELIQKQESLRGLSFTLAPKMRPVGSGSTSDMEFKAYMQAIADLGNTKLANYLSLYMFRKTMIDSEDAINLKMEMITEGYGPKEVRQALDDFYKERGSVYISLTRNDDESDAQWDSRLIDWFNKQRRGTVIYNFDRENGDPLFTKTVVGRDGSKKQKSIGSFLIADGKGSWIDMNEKGD